jgi:EmrB/QacA subfamily drug resistance transporter
MRAPVTSEERRWWSLGVVSLATLMVALDATIINIALPRAQADLNFSASNRQWLITSYALAFGSLLLLGGRLSDLWGRRRALFIGMTGFALASALGGSAHTFGVLVTARAIQGAFGALLAPAALATMTTTFVEPTERAKAFSFYGAVGGSGAAIGLVLGGALTQWASWRWCLFINVVIAGVALVGAALFVEPGREEYQNHLDVLGTVLASAGLFFIVYGLGNAVTQSWSDEKTWGSLLLGMVLLVTFTWWQRRARYPLLPLKTLLNRTRGGSLAALFLTNASVFGVSLFLAYYLQTTLGYSPLRTGIDFLPMVASLALSAFFASARLLAKVGPRPLIPTGMLLAMMGMILLTKLGANSNYVGDVFPGLVVTGLGLGMIYAPAVASATAGVARAEAGAASALVNTTQQIGGSVGVALLNTIAVSVSLRYVQAHDTSVGATSTEATLHGYAVAFWWAAGFFGAGAIVSFLLLDSSAPDFDEGKLSTASA